MPGAVALVIPSMNFRISAVHPTASITRCATAGRAFPALRISSARLRCEMLGRSEGQSAFSDIAFPSHPLHMLAQAAVPVIEAWYRLRDTGGIRWSEMSRSEIPCHPDGGPNTAAREPGSRNICSLGAFANVG